MGLTLDVQQLCSLGPPGNTLKNMVYILYEISLARISPNIVIYGAFIRFWPTL